MRRLLREPLFHFFILGALLFALYGGLREGFGAPDEIVVSRAQVDNLRLQYSKLWQRPPTRQELDALIDHWVREEVLYREGLAMGLDRNDAVIRRRVVQKLGFQAEGTTPAVPSEAELKAWLDTHPDDYRLEPSYSLRQVYFDPARRGVRLAADVAAARAVLASGDSVAGDSTMLPSRLDRTPISQVARVFGSDFATALDALEAGQWSAPVRSGFGVHLVRIDARSDGRLAKLHEVRQAVERDLLQARTQQANEAFYARLLQNYTVKIEGPNIAPANASAAGSAETDAVQGQTADKAPLEAQ